MEPTAYHQVESVKSSIPVSHVTTRELQPTSLESPKLICDPGVTCGYWEYFIPGECCLSVYPNNENGRCTQVDLSLDTVYHNGSFIQGCIVSAGFTQMYTWLGGPAIDLGSDVFSCVTGGFYTWVS